MAFAYPVLFLKISEDRDEDGCFIEFPYLFSCPIHAHEPTGAWAHAVDMLAGWIGVGGVCGHPLNCASMLRTDGGFVEMVPSDKLNADATIAERMAHARLKVREPPDSPHPGSFGAHWRGFSFRSSAPRVSIPIFSSVGPSIAVRWKLRMAQEWGMSKRWRK